MWECLLSADLSSDLWVPPWSLLCFPSSSSPYIHVIDHIMPAAVPHNPPQARAEPPYDHHKHSKHIHELQQMWALTLVDITVASCWHQRVGIQIQWLSKWRAINSLFALFFFPLHSFHLYLAQGLFTSLFTKVAQINTIQFSSLILDCVDSFSFVSADNTPDHVHTLAPIYPITWHGPLLCPNIDHSIRTIEECLGLYASRWILSWSQYLKMELPFSQISTKWVGHQHHHDLLFLTCLWLFSQPGCVCRPCYSD